MRHQRFGHILMAISLGVPSIAWAQGGRAGRAAAAAAQQITPPAGAPANSGGRGGAVEFYSYDTTANASPQIPDAAPAESHQKITVNGETLAYTARAGYLPLRNATTGQAEAHIFYTSYSKEGVTDASVRPLLFFLGGAPGVAATWQEFGGLGPKRMKCTKEGTAGSPPYTGPTIRTRSRPGRSRLCGIRWAPLSAVPTSQARVRASGIPLPTPPPSPSSCAVSSMPPTAGIPRSSWRGRSRYGPRRRPRRLP